MAEDPENLMLVMLREIRAKQDEHTDRLERVETRLQHLEKQFDDFANELESLEN